MQMSPFGTKQTYRGGSRMSAFGAKRTCTDNQVRHVSRRFEALPDVPTIAEALPGYEDSSTCHYVGSLSYSHAYLYFGCQPAAPHSEWSTTPSRQVRETRRKRSGKVPTQPIRSRPHPIRNDRGSCQQRDLPSNAPYLSWCRAGV